MRFFSDFKMYTTFYLERSLHSQRKTNTFFKKKFHCKKSIITGLFYSHMGEIRATSDCYICNNYSATWYGHGMKKMKLNLYTYSLHLNLNIYVFDDNGYNSHHCHCLIFLHHHHRSRISAKHIFFHNWFYYP